MKNEKRKFLVLIVIFAALSIDAYASFQKQDISLQWFPSLAADNDTVYVAWADERNGNYTQWH